MKLGNSLPGWMRKFGRVGLFLLVGGACGWAQESSPPASQADAMAAAVHELQEQVRELRAAVVEMRSEAAQYRAETAELRRELQMARSPAPNPAPSSQAAGSAPAPTSVEKRVSSLEESSQLLAGKVDEQYQTKVESASKYRMRLSGLVLLNIFSNRGDVNSLDVPDYVPAPSGVGPRRTFGATLRQSQLGLEVFGPKLAGAKTSGNLQFDFSGGFPNTLNGVSLGVVRLRIASMRMDWGNTSIVAGQDNLFLSPLSPTSFASLAVPTFGYEGNLWGWTPQVRVEHRFDLAHNQNITVQAGVLDNLTGEPPFTQFERLPQGGERSGQPAYAVRVAYARTVFGQPLSLGAAGYYSRQDWWLNRHVDGWAGMTDWQIPVAPRVSLSGEFYRGLAVGGLGGGVGRSVLFSGNPFDPNTQLRALDSIGGWSQLKVKATSTLEFNGAFGMDNPFAEDVRAFSASQSYFDPTLLQNRAALLNVIYRPRSNLLLSTEYRHLRTFDTYSGSQSAEQVNLIMGILF